jgi:hypothetical protein
MRDMAKNTGSHLGIFRARLILIPMRKTQNGSCILAIIRLGITMIVLKFHLRFDNSALRSPNVDISNIKSEVVAVNIFC